MARGEPEPIAATWRRLRLVTLMSWRHWFPTAAEQSERAERMAGRFALGQQQRHAAAAFRWTLLRQRSAPASTDRWDDPG